MLVPHKNKTAWWTTLVAGLAMARLALAAGIFTVAQLSATNLSAAETEPRALLAKSKRVIFLGDSVTYAGGYIGYLDAWQLSLPADQRAHLIDAGLPSETVSGLSEDGHAGGQFPRPDLAERLDRILEATKPNLVFACYGINCGIYEPFSESRLERYQQGYTQLKAKVEKAGAQLVIITPPFYDDMRAPKPFSYNAVLDKYAAWLMGQRKAGWQVFDLHTAMTAEVLQRRKTDPQFTFQPDGVHPNDEAHWFLATQLIRWLGDESAAASKTPQEMLAGKKVPAAALPLVQQRMAILRDSYVSTAGHKRPGMAPGLPIVEAETKAQELTSQIEKLLEEAGKK